VELGGDAEPVLDHAQLVLAAGAAAGAGARCVKVNCQPRPAMQLLTLAEGSKRSSGA
jgi:hypothetical protein